ncbi:MAG: L-idonate 5-dehydrogenase [Janthinobacterium lividum]
MKAVVIHAPHDLRFDDWEADAAAPGPMEVQVRIGAGGICGSDLHYYHQGGFGVIRVQHPMVLGHEIAGTVSAVGAGVQHVTAGDRVAVSPSVPCGHCKYCQEGLQQHCLDMRFYGSAMRNPHVHGGFREQLTCRADQAHRLPPGTELTEAAFAEPLAVCLHAARQAGPLQGKRVLVSGCGPIGALSVMVARHGGAREIVVTDLLDEPLALARQVGADEAINMAATPEGLARFGADKGTFDVVFEASGSASAVAAAIGVARPQATFVQLGIGGAETPLPLNLVVSKELSLRGTFRFHEEFAVAVDVIGRRRIDVRPLLSLVLPAAEAKKAFDVASDRKQAMKVQLAF